MRRFLFLQGKENLELKAEYNKMDFCVVSILKSNIDATREEIMKG